jgi:hypothetical protein
MVWAPTTATKYEEVAAVAGRNPGYSIEPFVTVKVGAGDELTGADYQRLSGLMKSEYKNPPKNKPGHNPNYKVGETIKWNLPGFASTADNMGFTMGHVSAYDEVADPLGWHRQVRDFLEYVNGKDPNLRGRFSDIEHDQRQLWHYGQEGEPYSRGDTYEDFNRYYAAKYGDSAPAPKTDSQRAIDGVTRRKAFEDGDFIPEGASPATHSTYESILAGDLGPTQVDRGEYGAYPEGQVPRPQGGVRSTRVADIAGNPQARQDLKEQVVKGLNPYGLEFYDTEAIRDIMVASHGEQQGHAMWSDFMHLIAEFSPQTGVESDIRIASYWRRMLWDPTEGGRLQPGDAEAIVDGIMKGLSPEGLADPEDILAAGGGLYPQPGLGYGSKTARKITHDLIPWIRGAPDDPLTYNKQKVRAFADALLGGTRSVAIDIHFMRQMGMLSGSPRAWMEPNWATIAPDRLIEYGLRANQNGKPSLQYGFVKKVKDEYKIDIDLAIETTKNWDTPITIDGRPGVVGLKDIPSVYQSAPTANEYGKLEKFWQEIAKEVSAEQGFEITPVQAQASIWMAMAERTGVTPGSQGTVLTILRDMLRKKAKKEKIPVVHALHKFLNNGWAISFLGALFGIKAYSALGGPSPGQQAQETGEFSYGGGPTAGPRDLAAALGPPPGPGGQPSAFSSIQPQLMGV